MELFGELLQARQKEVVVVRRRERGHVSFWLGLLPAAPSVASDPWRTWTELDGWRAGPSER